MSKRKFILKGKGEMVLPVTPASFEVSAGKRIEVVNVHEMGDVHLAGYQTLCTIRISCMLPAHGYPFARGTDDPYAYIERLKNWAKGQTPIRFVVSDTDVNLRVLVEQVQYGEQDGTNDVYVQITLREYRALKAVRIRKTAAASRPRETEQRKTSDLPPYTVKYGDTLCGICRRFYGDGSYQKAAKLSAANFGNRNPNILWVGEVIHFPPNL